jgi:hypothetical protein
VDLERRVGVDVAFLMVSVPTVSVDFSSAANDSDGACDEDAVVVDCKLPEDKIAVFDADDSVAVVVVVVANAVVGSAVVCGSLSENCTKLKVEPFICVVEVLGECLSLVEAVEALSRR